MNRPSVTPSPGARSGFTLCELIATFGLLMLLFGCVYGALHQLYRMQSRYQAEGDALVILANTVERLAAEPRPTTADVRTVFDDECRHSTAVRQGLLAPSLQEDGGRAVAGFTGPDGRPWITVPLGN